GAVRQPRSNVERHEGPVAVRVGQYSVCERHGRRSYMLPEEPLLQPERVIGHGHIIPACATFGCTSSSGVARLAALGDEGGPFESLHGRHTPEWSTGVSWPSFISRRPSLLMMPRRPPARGPRIRSSFSVLTQDTGAR